MDVRAFVLVSSASAGLWLGVFLILVPRLSVLLFPGYKLLTRGDRLIWNNKVMSVLNAVLTGTVAIVALIWEELPKLYNGTLWWLLAAAGVSRNSRLYVTNGLVFAASFLLSRILPIPYYWTQSLQLITSPQTYVRFGAVGLGFWFIADLLFDGINCFWAVKICRGTYKFMKTRKLE
uniref:TLC domain-containing protein n=1 Tax=Branchiostoma floridae TaxID=7739 RepID=C3ZTC8_BRAFL|eukprot:XP_002588164.1 hypothetical protein BRAFLDRAFT_118877 [Branchiostoma floridae]